ncbi:MAG: hypothetical protein ABIP21_13220 [Acidimicrobiia bacterium]
MAGGNQPAEAGAAIKYGWEKFKQHWQVILTALIVGFVAVAILSAIGFAIQRGMTSTGDCSVRVSNGGVLQSSGCESPGFFTSLAATGVFQVLYYLGTTILQLFVIRATLMIVRGEKLEASRVMSFDNFGPYILTALLVAVMTFVGLILCIIPGLAVMFFTMFWGYFVVDKNMSPVEAITASFNLVKNNVGAVIIFLLLSWVVTFVGFIACLIGLIVAIPVVTIATGYMYKRLQGEPVAA